MSTRAVFDCMVFLQAVTNEQGPAFACLGLVEEEKLELVVSPVILAELRDVLSRPKVRAKFPHLTDERAEGFIYWLEDKGITLAEVPRAFEYPRDPDDEPYINLAVASDSRYLVSRDKDLLDHSWPTRIFGSGSRTSPSSIRWPCSRHSRWRRYRSRSLSRLRNLNAGRTLTTKHKFVLHPCAVPISIQAR